MSMNLFRLMRSQVDLCDALWCISAFFFVFFGLTVMTCLQHLPIYRALILLAALPDIQACSRGRARFSCFQAFENL